MVYSSILWLTTVATLFGVTLAQSGLSILAPGGPDLWWVAKSENTLVWTCHTSPYQNFTVLVANPTMLAAGPEAIVSIQQNYDCSLTIPQSEVIFQPGSGYTIQLSDIFNETHVYATSQPFEIMAAGSVYPAGNATPTESGTASSTGTGTSTGSGSTSTSNTSTKSSGASSLVVNAATFGAITIVTGLGWMLA